MVQPQQSSQWVVTRAQHLDGFLRTRLDGLPWSQVRKLVRHGKVFVNDVRAEDPALPLEAGDSVRFDVRAPRPGGSSRLASSAIVFVDQHVVVVNKPAGVSTVPFDDKERGTLRDQVRAWLNRTAKGRKDRHSGDLGVVHRIDKQTSGLVVFTRNLTAKRHLANQFRDHSVERTYLAIVNGIVTDRTFESWLVQDRGDGLRGSTRARGKGKRAVTHVHVEQRLRGATLVSCRLETGRTHQIRIHVSEAGHPLVGERVYVRGHKGPWIPAERMLLHAASLGFQHPVRDQRLAFYLTPPDDFLAVLRKLGGKPPVEPSSKKL